MNIAATTKRSEKNIEELKAYTSPTFDITFYNGAFLWYDGWQEVPNKRIEDYQSRNFIPGGEAIEWVKVVHETIFPLNYTL